MKHRRHRGIVLSLVIVILVIMLVLGTSVASMGTGNLNIALSQLNSERAYQVAEGGLVYGYGALALNPAPKSTTYTLASGDQCRVEFYANPDGSTPQPEGCPTTIPKGYTYIVSVGKLMDGGQVTSERKVGALVCRGGGGSLSYGVNCHDLIVNAGTLCAYDLRQGLFVPGRIVAATNATTGTPSEPAAGPAPTVAARPLKLGGPASPVAINGTVLLPDGVSKGTVLQADSNIVGPQVFSSFASKLNVPKINVPVLAQQSQGSLTSGPLPQGEYEELNLSGTFNIKGRYVVKRINRLPGGRLNVPNEGAAEIYVTEKLAQDGPSDPPLFRNLNSSNHLKVFYTGDAPQTLNLDANAHLALVAPFSSITLNAGDMTLGAFVARSLRVNLPPGGRFCYDPAAEQPILDASLKSMANPPRSKEITPPAESNASAGPAHQDLSRLPNYQGVTVVGRQRF